MWKSVCANIKELWKQAGLGINRGLQRSTFSPQIFLFDIGSFIWSSASFLSITLPCLPVNGHFKEQTLSYFVVPENRAAEPWLHTGPTALIHSSVLRNFIYTGLLPNGFHASFRALGFAEATDVHIYVFINFIKLLTKGHFIIRGKTEE